MNKRPVINDSVLPVRRLPIYEATTILLLLRQLHVPGWVWGVYGTLMVIWFSWILYRVATEVKCEVELFLPNTKVKVKDLEAAMKEDARHVQ